MAATAAPRERVGGKRAGLKGLEAERLGAKAIGGKAGATKELRPHGVGAKGIGSERAMEKTAYAKGVWRNALGMKAFASLFSAPDKNQKTIGNRVEKSCEK